MESIRKHYRMDSRQIGFFRFLLEGYDGIASLTTLDPQGGYVMLSIAPGRGHEAETLLQELRGELLIETTDPAEAAVFERRAAMSEGCKVTASGLSVKNAPKDCQANEGS